MALMTLTSTYGSSLHSRVGCARGTASHARGDGEGNCCDQQSAAEEVVSQELSSLIHRRIALHSHFSPNGRSPFRCDGMLTLRQPKTDPQYSLLRNHSSRNKSSLFTVMISRCSMVACGPVLSPMLQIAVPSVQPLLHM